jgi:hypothetical protein
MRRTKQRVINLHRAFGLDNHELNAHVLRFAVLYEDLRIELDASNSHELKMLERAGFDYRRFYFIRRAISTAVEFAEAFRLLNDVPAFAEIKSRFPEDQKTRWDAAVAFFREHEDTFKDVRNDIGGHFGYPAALHAVKNLHEVGDGLMEFMHDVTEEKGGICFGFAEQVVAAAMARHKRSGETSPQYIDRIFSLLSTGFEHAVRATEAVGVVHILETISFGRKRIH